ncbi:acetoacetate--CoA ligase [Pseudonocardia sp. EV170527-09]|uniref:acetoacetate--CoA ligase n=1 Tax=Pseudonocardia sp. EV170527-09 TaxID=2603411 RepID=UPI0011F25749|nr:acetoacetate--CoA ligase [Pseudonocardia sp. EV170527-09]KAA1027871.1 acetoacetate--CoA ligase [Pseudonocardia sp. EV170527-09]
MSDAGAVPADRAEILWTPSDERRAASGLARYLGWVSGRMPEPVDDYPSLWNWSVRPGSGFWASLAEFLDIAADGDWSTERESAASAFSGAGWFPDVRLNYAEQALRDDADGPALIQVSEDRPTVTVSWSELRGQVGAFAAQLRGWGVEPGDRVAGYLPSVTEAVVALLGSAAVGAVWTCCAPDYGTDAVLDRLTQVHPRVLVAADGYRFAGRDNDRVAQIRQLAQRLPDLEQVVVVPRIHDTVDCDLPVPVTGWSEIVTQPTEPVFTRLPFDHPLWILYSSGTSGPPKGIVHSQGGIVLEHAKWLALHADVRAGDRFFWFSSTAWVVWNAAVAALMVDATVVLYDGSPNRPRPDRLWEIAAETRATQFGTGAGYLTASRQAGLVPGRDHDLSAMRSVLYSGSVLPVDGWRWVYEAVEADIWLDAPCGGTDVGTSYVGGNPLSPVYAGEMQCRLLGARVESWDEQGRHATDRVGELVVTAPMPSMPVRFWNDPGGHRFREAYFDVYPGVWRHGDWITITSRGTAVVHGRSDSTLNRHGVRLGSADIYAAVDRIPEVADSLVIGAELDGGGYWMPLFVSLVDGIELDEGLRARIAEEIRRFASVRHVPDEILLAPGIPRTLTGKRLEVPVKRLLQGLPRDHAVNAGVVDRPEVLAWFSEVGARHRKATTCAS